MPEGGTLDSCEKNDGCLQGFEETLVMLLRADVSLFLFCLPWKRTFFPLFSVGWDGARRMRRMSYLIYYDGLHNSNTTFCAGTLMSRFIDKVIAVQCSCFGRYLLRL